MQERKAFDFINISEKSPKPHTSGIIEIRGSYYTPVVLPYLKGLFEIASDYIDGLKFAGGSQRLHPVIVVKEIIKLCHANDIYVSTGGFIERVIVQGPKAVEQYLEETKNLGFDVVEVSSGLADISLKSKIEIVKKVCELGMKPKPEITFMPGAGAGTKIVGYESIKLRGIDEIFEEADAYLKAGAYMLMFESEGITEDLPAEKWRVDLITAVVQRYGFKKWMFEAAEPAVFKWYLKKFGHEVNLFIDHSQIIEFEAWRSKLWGDRDIWKGKKLGYP